MNNEKPLTEGRWRNMQKGLNSPENQANLKPIKPPPSGKVKPNASTLPMAPSNFPETNRAFPYNLDDELPITTKQVYELVRFLSGGGECPDLLFKVDGVHFKGKLP